MTRMRGQRTDRRPTTDGSATTRVVEAEAVAAAAVEGAVSEGPHTSAMSKCGLGTHCSPPRSVENGRPPAMASMEMPLSRPTQKA